MAHKPNRFVANAEHAVNLMCRHSLFAGAHQVGREKPAVKRDVAILKNTAHGDRELLTTAVALPHTVSDGLLGVRTGVEASSVIDLATMRTHRAFGPAYGFQQLTGVVLGKVG